MSVRLYITIVKNREKSNDLFHKLEIRYLITIRAYLKNLGEECL